MDSERKQKRRAAERHASGESEWRTPPTIHYPRSTIHFPGIAGIFTLILCGCAGEEFYSPIVPANLSRLRPDVTKRDYVIHLFSDPDTITTAPDGTEVLTYVDTVIRVRQYRLLPGLVVFGNTRVTSDSHYLEVYIRDGIVRGHRHRTTLPPNPRSRRFSSSGEAPAHGEAWGPPDDEAVFPPDIPGAGGGAGGDAERQGPKNIDAPDKGAKPRGAKPPEDARAAPAPGGRKGRRPRVAALEGEKVRYEFEGFLQGWRVPRFLAMITGKVAHTTRKEDVHGGRGALKLSYAYQKERIPLVFRHDEDLKGVRYLRFFARALYQDLTLLVGVSEGHKADYNTTVNVGVEDGWVEINLDLSEFELSDDGRDVNGKLDADKIESLMIADIGAFFEQQGENVLLIDDIVGSSRPLDGRAAPRRPKGRRPPKGKKVPVPIDDDLVF